MKYHVKYGKFRRGETVVVALGNKNETRWIFYQIETLVMNS